MILKTPIVYTSLQDRVYEVLRGAILNGDLRPGESLSLTEISKQLNVSTTPVREALRRLEAQGLVTFSTQKRITVTELSVEELEEFYWIRIPLECRAFSRNFLELKNAEIEKLGRLNKRMCRSEISAPEWVQLNRRFHMILYGATKNPILKGALAWLWDNVTPYLNIYAQDRSRIDEAGRMHAKIIEAVKKKRRKEGIKLMEEHLRSGYLVRDSLRKK